MTYFTGNNLRMRVEAGGLDGVFEVLGEVAAKGLEGWPGPIEITPANLDEIESIRVLIYSMLYSVKLKGYFSVKRSADGLILDKKSKSCGWTGVKAQTAPYSGPATATIPNKQSHTLGDEGLKELFDETEPAWLKAASEKRESEQALGLPFTPIPGQEK